jgi:hypothetical protein
MIFSPDGYGMFLAMHEFPPIPAGLAEIVGPEAANQRDHVMWGLHARGAKFATDLEQLHEAEEPTGPGRSRARSTRDEGSHQLQRRELHTGRRRCASEGGEAPAGPCRSRRAGGRVVGGASSRGLGAARGRAGTRFAGGRSPQPPPRGGTGRDGPPSPGPRPRARAHSPLVAWLGGPAVTARMLGMPADVLACIFDLDGV